VAAAPPAHHVIAQNRQARFHYEVLDVVEAGVLLTGSEVKSLRSGKASIAEAYAAELLGQEGHDEIYLINANIDVYPQAKMFNHEPKRPRKLLLHKKEIKKMLGAIRRKGMTLVPLSLYFNNRGLAKIELALCRGKNVVDKRQTIKERDWAREKSRVLKGGY
jgi:SsrA-binding protein